MPKGSKKAALERRLTSQGMKRGLKGTKLKAYVYGTLNKVMGPRGPRKKQGKK